MYVRVRVRFAGRSGSRARVAFPVTITVSVPVTVRCNGKVQHICNKLHDPAITATLRHTGGGLSQ